ncbi:hypothetical protein Lalb_Chr10g0094371 [Lupinus albus]|uniref:F-box domain-containing protein n=1 Tax=Lupinus albus TaxID=3870 RepID=A0A6A4PV75_LUPAL|nr:hypothetical protein Lalb_Chr10g0094371 [Lupinus albus]
MSDFVLLYRMEFMNVKDVFQTCILSKRWKNLWKSMTNLTLYCIDNSYIFSKFVSRMLSDRDIHQFRSRVRFDPPLHLLLSFLDIS